MPITRIDVRVAQDHLARCTKQHWTDVAIWESSDVTALVLKTSKDCSIYFVVFLYDDGTYDLVGNPSQVIERYKNLSDLLVLFEDITVY